MHTISVGRACKLSEIQPGELIRTRAPDEHLAVVLDKNDLKMHLVQIPSGSDGFRLYGVSHQAFGRAVIAYGPDWALELAGEELRMERSESLGSVATTPSGTYLCVEDGSRNGFGDTFDVNLVSLRVEAPVGPVLETSSWRIWLSREERDRLNAVPLYERKPST